MFQTIKTAWRSEKWVVVVFFSAIISAMVGIGLLPGTALGFVIFFAGSLLAYMYFIIMRQIMRHLERKQNSQKPRR